MHYALYMCKEKKCITCKKKCIILCVKNALCCFMHMQNTYNFFVLKNEIAINHSIYIPVPLSLHVQFTHQEIGSYATHKYKNFLNKLGYVTLRLHPPDIIFIIVTNIFIVQK